MDYLNEQEETLLQSSETSKKKQSQGALYQCSHSKWMLFTTSSDRPFCRPFHRTSFVNPCVFTLEVVEADSQMEVAEEHHHQPEVAAGCHSHLEVGEVHQHTAVRKS